LAVQTIGGVGYSPSSLLRKAVVAILNRAKHEAKLRAARKITTRVVS
jgi:hypothetical protein